VSRIGAPVAHSSFFALCIGGRFGLVDCFPSMGHCLSTSKDAFGAIAAHGRVHRRTNLSSASALVGATAKRKGRTKISHACLQVGVKGHLRSSARAVKGGAVDSRHSPVSQALQWARPWPAGAAPVQQHRNTLPTAARPQRRHPAHGSGRALAGTRRGGPIASAGASAPTVRYAYRQTTVTPNSRVSGMPGMLMIPECLLYQCFV
jgi:hypothetical protein